MAHVTLITPPFCQLNTPYAAAPFLSGTLKKFGHDTTQIDIGIHLFVTLFSEGGLRRFFEALVEEFEFSEALQDHYIQSVDTVIAFLQGADDMLSDSVNCQGFLPEGPRFDALEDMGEIYHDLEGVERAQFRASLYIDDLTDLMQQTIIPGFGLSKYRESIAQSPRTFDTLYKALHKDDYLFDECENLLVQMVPSETDIVALTVPFPGNLFMALAIGAWVKKHRPGTSVVVGGGYVNSELRQLTDARVFEYVDFICFDDGEQPLLALVDGLSSPDGAHCYNRTMSCENGEVVYHTDPSAKDLHVNDVGIPDYEQVNLDLYVTLYESVNPMHALWSQKGWLKLRAAHGCYWKKCSFCDVSLDYIARYQSASVEYLMSVIMHLVETTSCRSFHFVDEALPPKTAKMLSLAIIESGLKIEWWGNIRFENTFTLDLALLMRQAGCVAVTGGLEAVTDVVLDKMNKGITTESAVTVCSHFAQAEILTHSYLIYSFPTQTEQEGIDALEILRQMYSAGILHSSFWHRFSLTVHSPVAKEADNFDVKYDSTPRPFANNDLEYQGGGDLDHLADGFKKANYNFMHGTGFDMPIDEWFECEVVKTAVSENLVQSILQSESRDSRDSKRVLWFGGRCSYKKMRSHNVHFELKGTKEKKAFEVPVSIAVWLKEITAQTSFPVDAITTWADVKKEYPADSGISMDDMLMSELWYVIKTNGLLML